jgi:hypothetical protein
MGAEPMNDEQRTRAAALRGRERLPAARDMLRTMATIDERTRAYEQSLRVAVQAMATRHRRHRWAGKRRFLRRVENWVVGALILAGIALGVGVLS